MKKLFYPVLFLTAMSSIDAMQRCQRFHFCDNHAAAMSPVSFSSVTTWTTNGRPKANEKRIDLKTFKCQLQYIVLYL